MHWFNRPLYYVVCLLGASILHAQDRVSLIEQNTADAMWKFNNGAEFPGATGSLAIDPNASRQGKPSLKLVGDFTGGGGYVQAGRSIDKVDIRELSMWVRSPDSDKFTLRLNDSSGQTHQLNLKIEQSEDWQRIDLPLERFFERRGHADAVTGITKYEFWGGAKDGNWHGPATAIYLLVGNNGANKIRTMWLNEVTILSRQVPVAGAEVKSVAKLGEIVDGVHDWAFTDGREFPGAKGSLTVVDDQHFKLAGDFTGGGAYVAAIRDLGDLPTATPPVLQLRTRTTNVKTVTIQLVDGGGQTHQRKGFPIEADGEWHDVKILPTEIAGGEHWGGANDAKWHGGIQKMVVSITDTSDAEGKQPVLEFADISAEVLLPVFTQPSAFESNFEVEELGDAWTKTAGVAIDPAGSLRIERTLEDVAEERSVISPEFAVAPGRWLASLNCKTDLHSPDNSYNAVVRLECLDVGGKVIEQLPVAEVFEEHDWQLLNAVVEIPTGSVAARFQIQLNKTYGSFQIDDLKAAYLAPALRRDDRVSRLLFSTAQLGNLLFPEDSREVGITVEARKPLRAQQLQLTYVVRDYWGSEHTQPGSVALAAKGKQGDRFIYEASIDLASAPLEIGRYYELHAEIPGADDQTEPFRHNTSLAILPEAVTRSYKPEEIPFTSRNWDNRINEYIRLTDRLGIRICGLWGGWSHEPPYKPVAPGLELCQELGMGWLSNTPIATIERGEDKYDEQALRQGVRNFLETYGHARPLTINLGNEPHGTGEVVNRNVAAYQVVYEEIKKIDPSIPVVATSVEPNEEYFKNGYGQWCDAYDFHIYETFPNVRRTMNEYRELAKKYGVEKPIWSTELGLNSQGQPRHVVAVEVFKKLTTFFAAGGENVSWFGLLYPDGDGKSYGSSGDSHNVFDCRFNRYCPRLDAVAYYNAVNAIAIKKFVEEQHYEGGVSAYLFRDREDSALQVLWNDEGQEDVFVPLSGVEDVQLIHIDGTRSALNAGGKGITLSVSSDPILLLYNGGEAGLAPKLGEPEATLTSHEIGKTIELSFDADTELDLTAPPFWSVKRSGLTFSLTPPKDSAVREVLVTAKLKDSSGELVYRFGLSEL